MLSLKAQGKPLENQQWTQFGSNENQSSNLKDLLFENGAGRKGAGVGRRSHTLPAAANRQLFQSYNSDEFSSSTASSHIKRGKTHERLLIRYQRELDRKRTDKIRNLSSRKSQLRDETLSMSTANSSSSMTIVKKSATLDSNTQSHSSSQSHDCYYLSRGNRIPCRSMSNTRLHNKLAAADSNRANQTRESERVAETVWKARTSLQRRMTTQQPHAIPRNVVVGESNAPDTFQIRRFLAAKTNYEDGTQLQTRQNNAPLANSLILTSKHADFSKLHHLRKQIANDTAMDIETRVDNFIVRMDRENHTRKLREAREMMTPDEIRLAEYFSSGGAAGHGTLQLAARRMSKPPPPAPPAAPAEHSCSSSSIAFAMQRRLMQQHRTANENERDVQRVQRKWRLVINRILEQNRRNELQKKSTAQIPPANTNGGAVVTGPSTKISPSLIAKWKSLPRAFSYQQSQPAAPAVVVIEPSLTHTNQSDHPTVDNAPVSDVSDGPSAPGVANKTLKPMPFYRRHYFFTAKNAAQPRNPSQPWANQSRQSRFAASTLAANVNVNRSIPEKQHALLQHTHKATTTSHNSAVPTVPVLSKWDPDEFVNKCGAERKTRKFK